jgi:hypothetical protein
MAAVKNLAKSSNYLEGGFGCFDLCLVEDFTNWLVFEVYERLTVKYLPHSSGKVLISLGSNVSLL